MGSAFALPVGREGGRKVGWAHFSMPCAKTMGRARKTGTRMNNGNGEVMVRMERRNACGSRRLHDGRRKVRTGEGACEGCERVGEKRCARRAKYTRKRKDVCGERNVQRERKSGEWERARRMGVQEKRGYRGRENRKMEARDVRMPDTLHVSGCF